MSTTVGGVEVTRVLPRRAQRSVGPFVFLDHMGPARAAIQVPPHPHIGLSTVTYLFEGEIVHRDSLGFVQTITPGAINLMTAGAGIVHSERARAEELLHGVQMWLALPVEHEDDEPSFHHHAADSLPAWHADGVGHRLLLGELGAYRSPIDEPSGAFLLDLDLEPGASFPLPDDGRDLAVYHLERRELERTACVQATGATRVLVLGGRPLAEPRHLDWNFVASSRDRLVRARDRWRTNGFPTIPGDDQERVPYPGD